MLPQVSHVRCIVDFTVELSTEQSPNRDIWVVTLRVDYSIFKPKVTGFARLNLL